MCYKAWSLESHIYNTANTIWRKYKLQLERIYLLKDAICASNEDSNQPAHARSLNRILVARAKKLRIIGYTQSDLNLRWPQLPKSTLSDVAFHICFPEKNNWIASH